MKATADAGLVLGLSAAAGAGTARIGVKAATLAVLTRAGFAVPDALVLTADAAASHLHATAESAGDVLTAPLPAAVEAALQAIGAHFGDAVLAVRSSAAAEDLPDASFAGQYETVLHVRGPAALHDAVRRCWASAHGDRIRAYRRSRGQSGAAAIAVLVQRQVDPDVAGVAFTANPVTGDRDEVLVSAVPGLGDALVGGETEPDEWTVRGSAATAVRVVHQALTGEQARAVATVARRVEELLGGPQDVEWAMAGGRLLVLQARPVTALPRRPVADLPPGPWLKDVEHYPEPFTPLGASVAVPAVSEGLSAMFAAWGGLLERLDLRTVGGEAYAQPVPVGGHTGPPPPWWVLAVLARVAPPLRRRMRTAARTVRPEIFAAQLEEWTTRWKPQLAADTDRLGAVDLGGLGDPELAEHLGHVADLAHRALHLHFHLIPLYTVPPYELVEACRTLLGWDELDALTLLAGASETSSAPARALARVAARVAAQPAARAAVERPDADLAERLVLADADCGTAFAQWCAEYGTRCVHDDPGSPTYAERPWLLAGLLRDALAATDAGAADPQERASALREEATGRARAALAGRSRADRDRFERLLATALRYYPLREDTVFSLARISGALRRAALEAGRRLAARGDLDRPDDAVQLDLATLRAATAGPAQAELRELVAAARAERAWVRHHPGPPLLGPPPAPSPDVRGLPLSARRLNAALLWSQPRPVAAPSDADRSVLVGVAASPGRGTGPVRVVRTEADFGLLRPGDVLVAPTTDPAWSVLFGVAGALVTDGGGLLSHAGIVAREHALPAVVATGEATRTLVDGEIVTVDGSTGRVLRESHDRS